LQEKLFLGKVIFRKDVVTVIEKIERLRELEREARNMRGCAHACRSCDEVWSGRLFFEVA
jgi:hypothetical protein